MLKNGDVIEISPQISGKKTTTLLYPGKDEDRDSIIVRIDPSLNQSLTFYP